MLARKYLEPKLQRAHLHTRFHYQFHNFFYTALSYVIENLYFFVMCRRSLIPVTWAASVRRLGDQFLAVSTRRYAIFRSRWVHVRSSRFAYHARLKWFYKHSVQDSIFIISYF